MPGSLPGGVQGSRNHPREQGSRTRQEVARSPTLIGPGTQDAEAANHGGGDIPSARTRGVKGEGLPSIPAARSRAPAG